MDAFTKKTLKTARGYTYTYYTSSGDKTLPALLFQHGWPDHAAMWADVAGPLKSLNHTIIIPDMLGYDGTDKPTKPSEYSWTGITADMINILDAEQHEKFISIGHDWGSTAATRLAQYYPDRAVGLVNVSVAYTPPGRQRFDLDQVNQLTTKAFGYPVFAYWLLFTADDGAEVLDQNLERLYYAMHGEGHVMKELFCSPGAMREYLTTGNRDIKLRPYAKNPALKEEFMSQFKSASMTGPLCWYKAYRFNHHYDGDIALPASADKMNVPVLYIGSRDDLVCRPESMIPYIRQGLVPKLEQAELVDASHWIPYEKPEEVASRIEAWVKKNF